MCGELESCRVMYFKNIENEDEYICALSIAHLHLKRFQKDLLPSVLL